MTTAHDFRLTSLKGQPLDLAAFRGRPMLIVNTASKCAYTPQYAALQALWAEYKDRGLVVLGVPSNDFGKQEPGSSEDIAAFCDRTFGISFPLTQRVHVRGRAADPLFKWLAREAGPLGRPWWNFTKYVIGRDGRLVDWFFFRTPPDAAHVRRVIERTL